MVREQLEMRLGLNLESRKKEIDDVVMECIRPKPEVQVRISFVSKVMVFPKLCLNIS